MPKQEADRLVVHFAFFIMSFFIYINWESNYSSLGIHVYTYNKLNKDSI